MTMSLILSALLALPTSAQQAERTGRSEATESRDPCSARSGSAAATFEDENLEAAVRSALSLEGGVELTCGLVATLDSLVAPELEIENLHGIQNLAGLEHLDLWGNAITDIGELIELTRLTRLELGNNSISDVSALAALTNLTRLSIRENEIADISALGGLTQLIDLDISYNGISELAALRGMTRLTTLRVYNNPIADIDAMRDLTSLSELHVHDLTDLETIRPLVENTGLGSGDLVYVYGSNACSDARALRDKGVSVPGCEIEDVMRWWWAIFPGLALVAFALVLRRRRNQGQ